MRLPTPEVVTATGGTLVVPSDTAAPVQITGVAIDSRLAKPGDVFIALRGPRTDGHHFVADAMAHGAVLAVVADASAARGPALVVPDPLRALGAIAGLYRRTLVPAVIGITGSVGKTTTVRMCARVLEERFVTARSAESWNAEIGVALALLALEPSHQVAVIEMAMRGPGQLRELVEMAQPRIGAVTNIADTHLESLGSREQIAAAKAELLEGLPASGVAIISADDPYEARLTRNIRCRVVRFGAAPAADVRATEIRSSADGCRFVLHLGPQSGRVSLPVVGAHQARNALVAAAVGQVLGLTLEEIGRGLSRASAPKMRQELSEVAGVMILDDSYNASPQSMAATFDVLRQVGGARRRILALGEMRELGSDARAFHRDAGADAAALRPALLLVVGPNAGWYLEGALRAGLPAAAGVRVETPEEAIPILLAAIRPGDIVLVKGSRAIEMERVVAGMKIAVRSHT